jgi:UDP-N-acetyl-D-glucosamine/UDP-N-acetyl-D-galactosamine dehydrogenase
MIRDSIVVSVTGLGYVGLPVAVAMAKAFKTIGFDINSKRVKELSEGIDHTGEVDPQDLKKSTLQVTDQIETLRTANFHIIAVPTPVNSSNQPDLTPLIGATRTIAQVLKKGDIVVYESTVYPGLTEEDCIPVLEQISGLKSGVDFKVGYSPERINPGDKLHTLEKIKKVVSAQDAESLETVAFVYGSVITAGIHKATSIKVAEAAKVIENTQRDLNIALMNELAIIFDQMGIDTHEVLEAAATKWNFLKFTPGLVGGHCIGVDPYYLTHKAEKLGYQPQVILAGRRINDGMGKFVAMRTVKEMVRAGHAIHNARVTVLGLTFKEDCPDLRNSKVINIINELRDFGLQVQVADPLADRMEALEEYGVELTPFDQLLPSSAVVVAVAHEDYKRLAPEQLKKMMGNDPVVVDVKGIYSQSQLKENKIRTWRL